MEKWTEKFVNLTCVCACVLRVCHVRTHHGVYTDKGIQNPYGSKAHGSFVPAKLPCYVSAYKV